MEENRVDLDPQVKDKHGLPVPRITHHQHPNDIAMHRWYTQKMLEIADAAGAVESWPVSNLSEQNAMKGGGHLHGTCRMGNDPRTSVLDRWCRTHDVKNMFIVDSSIFVTSGGVNPVSTLQALALYIAANIKENSGAPD